MTSSTGSKIKRQGSTKLPTLITKGVEPPWGDVLLELSMPVAKLYPKLEQAFCARNVSLHRLIITCWVTKLKWNPRGIKIPRTRAIQGYRSLGEMFRWMLQFCIECHSYMSKRYGEQWNKTYPNAWQWFDLVFNELLNVPEVLANLGAEAVAQQHQSELNMLKCYENPYKQEEAPHTFYLFEAAIQMAEKSRGFNTGCYSKFLKAKRQYIASVRGGEWCQVRIDEKGMYYLTQRSSHKRRIPSKSLENWVEQLTNPVTLTQ